MKPQIYHVDAFTSEPFRGNSAGVVLHADGLSDTQMQLICCQGYLFRWPPLVIQK